MRRRDVGRISRGEVSLSRAAGASEGAWVVYLRSQQDEGSRTGRGLESVAAVAVRDHPLTGSLMTHAEAAAQLQRTMGLAKPPLMCS